MMFASQHTGCPSTQGGTLLNKGPAYVVLASNPEDTLHFFCTFAGCVQSLYSSHSAVELLGRSASVYAFFS
jgi:hypothetical protein